MEERIGRGLDGEPIDMSIAFGHDLNRARVVQRALPTCVDDPPATSGSGVWVWSNHLCA